jgi:hypothetical protein
MFRPNAPSIVAMLMAAVWACAGSQPLVGQDVPRSPPARLPTAEEAANPAYAPHMPAATSRPADWPGGVAAAGAVKGVLSSIRARPGEPLAGEAASLATDRPGQAGVVQTQFTEETLPPLPADAAPAASSIPPPLPEATSVDAALKVGRVGPEVILEADLLTPKALEWLAQVSPTLPPEKLREVRLQICQQVIDQHIEMLLVYVDACREIPEDKLPEIRKNVDKSFDETQLPSMMADEGVSNSLEFERRLRERGTSLDRIKKMFFERGLAQEWLRKNAGEIDEIPHAELIAYYHQHLDEYDYSAKARFEILTIKTGLKRSQTAAWEILAGMGNEVLAGRPFADVAKSRSEGPTASAGGAYDWITKGSLAMRKVDEAIFSLPVGELSSIIEDGEALHIVRVTERKPDGRIPFLEAQVEIRKTLTETKRKAAVDDYLAKLRARTPVWTVFDDTSGNANEPVFTAGRPTAPTRR